MKLLSNLESLDNITDGENKKLDIHYIDITSPYFVFNSMEPGLYINKDLSIISNTQFKLNDECTGGLHISFGLRFYLHIIQNPSTVEDDTVFAYLYTVRGNNATVGSNLLGYKVTLKKDLSADSGLHLNNYYEKVFVSDLPSKYSSCFIGTGGSTYNKTGELGVSQFLQPCYLQVALNSGNTAQRALTLNINSGGARPIYINGEPSSATNYDLPRGTYIVYTDGTNYYFNTDGTIPRVIHGDDSIKRIVELDYEDYKELEDNDEVDPDTEYHIPESSINEQTIKKACKIVSFYRTSGWTTQSTTDVDIPNATATVTTNGGNVLVTVTTSLNVTGNMAFVALYVDDTLHSEILCLNATIGSQALTASALVTNLNAGEHTFALKMHVQNTNNVATLMTYNTQQMVIQEL